MLPSLMWNNFEDRFGNHKMSFNHAKHKNDTELSKEFWEIKKRSGTPKITRKIITVCCSYNPNSKRYLLCLNEKYEIAPYKGDSLLNKKTEIIKTCRHRSKYKLANYHTIDWRQIHAIRYHYNASFKTVTSYFVNFFSWRLITWNSKF